MSLSTSDPNPASQPFGDLLTYTQLALYLGCCRRTVEKLCKSNAIASVKVGRLRRFRIEDVLQYINAQRISSVNG